MARICKQRQTTTFERCSIKTIVVVINITLCASSELGLYLFLFDFIPNIQSIVLAAEETTATQWVSHRPIKCQSRSWSHRGTKVNGSHHGDKPRLKPTGIQIPKNPCQVQQPNNSHRKRVGVKTMSLGTNHGFYSLESY